MDCMYLNTLNELRDLNALYALHREDEKRSLNALKKIERRTVIATYCDRQPERRLKEERKK